MLPPSSTTHANTNDDTDGIYCPEKAVLNNYHWASPNLTTAHKPHRIKRTTRNKCCLAIFEEKKTETTHKRSHHARIPKRNETRTNDDTRLSYSTVFMNKWWHTIFVFMNKCWHTIFVFLNKGWPRFCYCWTNDDHDFVIVEQMMTTILLFTNKCWHTILLLTNKCWHHDLENVHKCWQHDH